MPKSNYYGLILAGGRGTRFWPRSRRRFAKQVMTLVGERSLIQSTVDRLAPVIAPHNIWVLTNEHLRDEIVRQLPEVPKRQILAEPAQRNTAPAIGLAAHILHSLDPEAVMGVFPSDHVVTRPGRYRQVLRSALRAAAQGKIAVLGIQPRWAETGYGYIEFPPGVKPGGTELYAVRRFREKPKPPDAEQFVKSGNFYWNSGMFFWRAAVLLEELRRHLPRTAERLASLPPFPDRRFAAALKEVFPLCENISIDYAVLEHADSAGIACGDIGWNDVGSWNAVYELRRHDRQSNSLPADSIAFSAEGNFVDARGKFVALLGVKDLIVVDTPDALLVADRKRSQDVGKLVALLEKAKRNELL
jgi:mannose-1-phosphate guanylyltransferase